MSALLQDVIVSTVALSAAAAIVLRARTALFSKRSDGACPSCPAKCGSRRPQPSAAVTQVPLQALRVNSRH